MRLLIIILFSLGIYCCFQGREYTFREEDTIAADDSGFPDISGREGVKVTDLSERIVIENDFYTIDFDKKRGYFSIKTPKSTIQNAVSEVVMEDGSIYATNDKDYSRLLEAVVSDENEDRITVLMNSEKSRTEMRLIFYVSEKERSLKFRLGFSNKGDNTIKIKKLRPLVLRSKKNGALFVGENPSEHRILENGSNGFLDFYVRLLPGDVKNDGIGSIFPFEMEGNSVSNWNNCVQDLKSGRITMAGFITYERSIPMVNLSFEDEFAKTDSSGRKGFTYFSLECPYIPVSLKLKKDEGAESEIVYLDMISDSCQDALESFAEGLKRYHRITLWNEKTEALTGRRYRVPNGWNSWSGGSGSGGYGTDINENLILQNLDVMKSEFREFGVDWFQIDDGWMVANGDWYLNKNRFPDHGTDGNIMDSFQYINNRIYSYGMKPGLWIAGLTAFKNSELYKSHPDWFAPKLPYASNDYQILDFSGEETIDFVYNTFKRIKDWGFKWVKLDFSYWVMAASALSDESVTPVEAYKRGLKAVREALGDDVHLLNVSATGPSVGIADSVRITLDNMPVWDGKSDNLYDMANQGIKPTVLTAARRYYYNQRVWINHPDLIFFRKMPEEKYPALTLDESRAFVSFAGITGGIVKIGEKIVEMRPEWIDSVRRILPVFPLNARPLDLFLREFPEKWLGLVRDTALPEYNIVGLFNWGRNRDLSVNPYKEIEESSRDYEVRFDEIGLEKNTEYFVYEFWDEKFYGVYKNGFKIKISPRRAMVFAIRKKTDFPSLLGTNRHILMGAEEIIQYGFDKIKNILNLKVNLSQSLNPLTAFEHRLYFYVPDGYNLSEVLKDSAVPEMQYNQDKNLLVLKIRPEKTTVAEINLRFGRKKQ
ncbi:MAG: alpha-galactosidase [Deltaproteobacteria bacterium]|nr:alpha-galactosidase [Deltaproteobacteria bacterium]